METSHDNIPLSSPSHASNSVQETSPRPRPAPVNVVVAPAPITPSSSTSAAKGMTSNRSNSFSQQSHDISLLSPHHAADLCTGNEEIDPIITSTLQEIQDHDYLSDLTISEQELIENEFKNYLHLIYQRLSNGLDDLQQHYLSHHHPPDPQSPSHPTTSSSHPTVHHHINHSSSSPPPPHHHDIQDNISIDSDSSTHPGQELISLILIDFQQFENKIKTEISQYLDDRFTKFRTTFHTFKKKLIDKLYQARIALHEYQKVIETSVKMDSKIQMELQIHRTIEEKLKQIYELETNLTRYRSAYEMASTKGTTLEMEKIELNEKIIRLEVKLDAAEERANRANRRVVTLEEQLAELTRQVEDLNSQKLLRQQMGNRKKTVGNAGSNGRQYESKTIRRPVTNQCAKCIILEDMCNQSKIEVDEIRKESTNFKEQCQKYQSEIEELHTKVEILLAQQEDIRARATAEIEAAVKLVEQSHPRFRSFHDDPSGVATPLDDSGLPVDDETQQLEEYFPADQDDEAPSIPANRLQEALNLDKQLTIDPTQQGSSESPVPQIGAGELKDSSPPTRVPSAQPARSSMSVFPTKKEAVTLTPVPITMNAQFFGLERPSSQRQRPLPVTTSATEETSQPPTPMVQPAQPSPLPLPSPSAYLQHYDDCPVTPELDPLIVSPPDVGAPARRASESVDYLTASQALEKQQRLSLRIQAVAAPALTPPDLIIHQQADGAVTRSPTVQWSSSHHTQDISSKMIANDAYEKVVKLLNEARANQLKLETENSSLKKANNEAQKNLEEMSAYLRTQDHINILKLKERDLLLKELTEQVNELRAQVKRDQKLLQEVKKGTSLPILESRRPPRKASENNNTKISVAPQLHKLDLTIEDKDGDSRLPRPSTASSGLRPVQNSDNHHLTRPSTSPAMGNGETEASYHLPSRPVNLSQSLKVFCGSSPIGKPSLFESQGLGAYEYCDIGSVATEEAKKEPSVGQGVVDILILDRHDREAHVKKEATDLRKKITLLMAHQEIVMSRGRLNAHPPHPSTSTPTSGQQRKKFG